MKSKTLDNICWIGFFLTVIFVLSGYKKSFTEGFDNPVDYPAPSRIQSLSCNMPETPNSSCKKRVGFWCSTV